MGTDLPEESLEYTYSATGATNQIRKGPVIKLMLG